MALASRAIHWLTIATLLALLAPAAVTRASVIDVRQVYAESDSIDSLSKATQLLGGSIPSAGEVNVTAAMINYVDPQSPAAGRFGGDVAFPGDSPGDDDDFAIFASSNVIIPTAGEWTFAANADNGVRVRVGSFVMSRSGFDNSTLVQTFAFPSPGVYPLSMTYYEHTGQSGIELLAGPGTITSGNDPAFRLVGDTFNGGLTIAPEPTGVMPLAVLAALLAGRRRSPVRSGR